MQNTYIDNISLQPKRFGEIYSDRNIRVVGECRFDPSANTVETRGLRVLLSPIGGGAEAITTVPDGVYTLAASDSSIWVQISRTGPATVSLGSTLLTLAAGTQPTAKENWLQLFYRTSVAGEVIAHNLSLLSVAPAWTRLGVARAFGYDAIVGTTSANPIVTHTNIQTAINDATDGGRILILSGTYPVSAGAGYSSTSALSWIGKSLQIEGQGFSTVIKNGGALARCFSIQGGPATLTNGGGSSSSIKNLQIQSFNQSIQFDGGAGQGVRNCDVNVWMTDYVLGSYSQPPVIGTGTSDQNSVREKTTATSGATHERFTIASSLVASNITRIETAGTLAFNELLTFNRPTSGFGVIPLGSVIATFPNLAGAYNCTATTVPDVNTGFVLCNGQTIVDPTSPMNGVVVPNINNNVFLAGALVSGVTGGANTIGTTVPAAGLVSAGSNGTATANWNSSTVAVSGSGSFNRGDFSTEFSQRPHYHANGNHSHTAGLYYANVSMNGNTIEARRFTTPSWLANEYGVFTGNTVKTGFSASYTEGVVISGSSGGLVPGLANAGNTGFPLHQPTYSWATQWNAAEGPPNGTNRSLLTFFNDQPVTFSGSNIDKNLWNNNQIAHTHTFTPGNVTGIATANTWDNRPLMITAKYLFRAK